MTNRERPTNHANRRENSEKGKSFALFRVIRGQNFPEDPVLRRNQKWLSMQRCRRNDVSAVRRKVMWRRVRPTFTHSNAISQVVPLARAFSPKRCEDASHFQLRNFSRGRTSRTRRAGSAKLTADTSSLWSSSRRISCFKMPNFPERV